MHDSDRAWLALAAGVAAYDLIATDNERLSDAARRYFKSQPVAPLKVLQAKFGFTVENIVATARI